MGAENPAHYKSHASGVECIQVIYPLYYGAGNAIKYLWRLGMKDSDLQELTKAMWYVIHSKEAGMEQPELMPFDSAIALNLWRQHEPAGYRKEAITCIYLGQYDNALELMKFWYGTIAKVENIEDVPLPVVPSVHQDPYADSTKIGGIEQ